MWSSRVKGSGSLAEDFGLRVERGDIGVGVVTGLLCQLVLVPAIYLPLQWAFGRQDISKPAKELAKTAHGTPYIGFAFAVIIAAPVIEEVFFRGLLLRSLERRFGTRWAVAGSSVAFGIAVGAALLYAGFVFPMRFPAVFRPRASVKSS